jgi:cell division septation protein DedD
MFQRNELYLFFLLVVLTLPAFAGSFSSENTGSDSVNRGVSQDETILFNMINDMRRQNQLPSFPLSGDLCKVARTHIADLIKYRPQDKGCSLHSWSGHGKWTSCCNTKELFGIQCMKAKPREIANYPGEGYELIYWGEDNATPAEAAELWKQVEASSDMILSHGKWSAYQWNAIGVGMEDGYAVLWLGDAEDGSTIDVDVKEIPVIQKPTTKVATVGKPAATVKESVIPKATVTPKAPVPIQEKKEMVVNVESQKFYLIVASYKDFNAATNVLKEVRLQGYPSAFILYQEPLHRVVINSYETYEKASAQKNDLKEKFPGIWIFKK